MYMNYLKKYQKYQNKIGGAGTGNYLDQLMLELSNYINCEHMRIYLLQMLQPHINDNYFDYFSFIDTTLINNQVVPLQGERDLLERFGNLFFNSPNSIRIMMINRLSIPFPDIA